MSPEWFSVNVHNVAAATMATSIPRTFFFLFVFAVLCKWTDCVDCNVWQRSEEGRKEEVIIQRCICSDVGSYYMEILSDIWRDGGGENKMKGM